jgi:hypothetical protein
MLGCIVAHATLQYLPGSQTAEENVEKESEKKPLGKVDS